MVEKDQAPGTKYAVPKSLRSGAERARTANGFKYTAPPGLSKDVKTIKAEDVDPSLDASEKRIKFALAVTTQRLQEQAERGGLSTDEIDRLAKVSTIYRTLAVTAAPFDPTKLSDEDLERFAKYLEKGK